MPGSRRRRRGPILVIAAVVVALAAVALFVSLNPIGPTSTTTSSSNSSSAIVSSSGSSTVVSSQVQTSQVSFSTVILGGTRPANFTMGNLIDSGLLSGMTWVDVGDGQGASIRFTAQSSGNAVQITTHGFTLNGTPSVILGLQADSNGTPSGTWLGGANNYGQAKSPATGGFITANLPTAVSIEQGQIYHLVVQPAPDSQGVFALTVYPALCHCQPMNFTDPDINWKDNAINTLTSVNGSSWTVANKYPVFAVTFADKTAIGQPFSLAAPWVIWGKTVVGQDVIPTENYSVGTISFVMTKLGNPTDDLHYTIYDSSNTVLSSGVFAPRQSFSNGLNVWAWKSATLPQPVTFVAGHLYRIVLSAPGTNLNNAYQLIGLEFSTNYSIGYGGFQDTLVSSLDGGSTWGSWNDADSMFKVTTAP